MGKEYYTFKKEIYSRIVDYLDKNAERRKQGQPLIPFSVFSVRMMGETGMGRNGLIRTLKEINPKFEIINDEVTIVD